MWTSLAIVWCKMMIEAQSRVILSYFIFKVDAWLEYAFLSIIRYFVSMSPGKRNEKNTCVQRGFTWFVQFDCAKLDIVCN